MGMASMATAVILTAVTIPPPHCIVPSVCPAGGHQVPLFKPSRRRRLLLPKSARGFESTVKENHPSCICVTP